ncbi:MAG: aminoacyl-tRNA hydrolase [Planctomycetota bacterium]|nr:MAG: aminoacyl-tRNA hydrolase [Planctomycetota bacterium]
MIDICQGISVSEHELSFSFERSPGPGGQNVNKVNTRVTLHFDLKSSTSLSNQQKNTIREALNSRINQDGVLRIHSSKERTQLANRRAAVNRFIELMSGVLTIPKPRKKTQVTAAAHKKRIDTKVRRGILKQTRQSKISIDE